MRVERFTGAYIRPCMKTPVFGNRQTQAEALAFIRELRNRLKTLLRWPVQTYPVGFLQ